MLVLELLLRGGSLLNLFDHTIQTLEKSLAYSSAKNRTIANNIANVDTPNFKAEKVEFKNVLTDVVNGKIENKRTHSKHFSFQEKDRKSTRLNSSHVATSYAVFCLKKKTELEKKATNTK